MGTRFNAAKIACLGVPLRPEILLLIGQHSKNRSRFVVVFLWLLCKFVFGLIVSICLAAIDGLQLVLIIIGAGVVAATFSSFFVFIFAFFRAPPHNNSAARCGGSPTLSSFA